MTTCEISGGEREETAGGKQKFSVKLIQGAFELQSFIFNIDVESYLALSVTNLKASFVHHYSPKHTIFQKFVLFMNLVKNTEMSEKVK